MADIRVPLWRRKASTDATSNPGVCIRIASSDCEAPGAIVPPTIITRIVIDWCGSDT